MSHDWAVLQAACDGVEPPTRRTLFTVAGTWSQWDWGFQADLARALGDEQYRWQPVGYPASFGPINPPFPGAPAYEQSVRDGVAELVRLINATPGEFALSGYSQGGEVVGRVCQQLTGPLKHRLTDCVACVTFGDPARQKTDETHGGGEGWGISRITITEGIRRVTYAVKGDMYCTAPDGQAGDQMHAVYLALTRMGDGKVNGLTDIAKEVVRIVGSPLTGGVAAVKAIILAVQVAKHNTYGPWVGHAADYLRAA